MQKFVRPSLVTTTTTSGPVMSLQFVRKTKYEHVEQIWPLGGHLKRSRRRRQERGGGLCSRNTFVFVQMTTVWFIVRFSNKTCLSINR